MMTGWPGATDGQRASHPPRTATTAGTTPPADGVTGLASGRSRIRVS